MPVQTAKASVDAAVQTGQAGQEAESPTQCKGVCACLFQGEGLELACVHVAAGNCLLLSHSRHSTFSGHGLPLHPAPRLPPTLGGVLTVQAQLALLVGLRLHLDAEEGVAQHTQQVPGHAAPTGDTVSTL